MPTAVAIMTFFHATLNQVFGAFQKENMSIGTSIRRAI